MEPDSRTGLIPTLQEDPIPPCSVAPALTPVLNPFGTVCLGCSTWKQVADLDHKHKLIQYQEGACDKPDQKGATCYGLFLVVPKVIRSCADNAANALHTRHAAPQGGDLDYSDDFWRLPEAIATVLGEQALFHFADYDVHYVIEDLWHTTEKWSANKLEAIQRSELLDAVVPGITKAHIKREIAIKFPTKGRLIQAYLNMATQSLLGPTFYALQKGISELLKRWQIPKRFGGNVRLTMASGLSPEAIGDLLTTILMDYKEPFFNESDGKSWDSKIQRAHWELAQRVYDIILGEGSEQARFFRAFRDARFKCKGICRTSDLRKALIYIVTGTVKSGDNDTTLSNTLINGLTVAAVFCGLGRTADVIVAGDDLLVVVEGKITKDEYETGIRKFGIQPEGEVFERLEHCSFISLCFWKQGDRYVATPAPGKVLAKFLCTTKPPSKRETNNFIHSICMGMRFTMPDMPIVRVFVDACDVEGQVMFTDSTNKTIQVNRKIYQKRNVETGSFLDAFAKRYHTTTAEVLSLENCLADTFSKLARVDGRITPHLVEHPLLAMMVAYDTCDPIERKRYIEDPAYLLSGPPLPAKPPTLN